jgi:hypothetical protein
MVVSMTVTVPMAVAVIVSPTAATPEPSQSSKRCSDPTEEPSSPSPSRASSGHLTHLSPHRPPLLRITSHTSLKGHQSLQVTVAHGEEELQPCDGVWAHSIESLQHRALGEIVEELLALRSRPMGRLRLDQVTARLDP